MKSFITLREALLFKEDRSEDDIRVKSLGLVRQHSGKPDMQPDKFQVRSMWLCNSARDHEFSRFSLGALLEVAELLPGKPVLTGHNYRTLPEGRFFNAQRVYRDLGQQKDDSYWVRGDFYVPTTPRGNELVDYIDAGVYREVSLGWSCLRATCSLCGNDINDRNMCGHVPGEVYEAGICDYEFGGITKVLEGSLVFAGGQKDTSTFNPEDGVPRQKSRMTVAEFCSPRNLDGRLIRAIKTELVRDLTIERGGERDPHLRDLRTKIQTVVCMKEIFRDSQSAKRWVRDHEFAADRMEGDPILGTEDSYRFRQFDHAGTDFDVIPASKKDPGVKFVVVKKRERLAGKEDRVTFDELIRKA
jgi:hypothetical protein